MNILAMDTSTQVMGISILKNNEIRTEIVTNIPKNHSVRLMPAIEQAMNLVGLEPKELDKIVTTIGPGSYTGIRIGLTTAKSMGWALNIPVVGVSSLEVMYTKVDFLKDISVLLSMLGVEWCLQGYINGNKMNCILYMKKKIFRWKKY